MKVLRILHVEDSETDAQLLDLELRRAGYSLTSHRVETARDLRACLARPDWDIILSDYSMPDFNGLEALEVLKESGRDLPFIIVSGSIGEESAIEALKRGAGDFIVKTNLARLAPAVAREVADVQTRREREEAFRALNEAVRARDEFLSIASHELKTPLAALQLQLQGLLRRMGADEDLTQLGGVVRRRLEAATRNSTRLSALIERLLEIGRLTSGRLDLHLETFDLAALARAALEGLEERAREARSPLKLETRGSTVGAWDRDRMTSVLDNLLDNALKYGAGAPILVAVKEAGDGVLLVVEDGGIGISQADQQRIFERFERAVPEKHFGGFGLGLWLTRKIVEAHGGKVSVASAEGRGSRFTVTVPRSGASA